MRVKLFSARLDELEKLEKDMNDFMSKRKIIEVKLAGNREFLADFIVIYEDS